GLLAMTTPLASLRAKRSTLAGIWLCAAAAFWFALALAIVSLPAAAAPPGPADALVTLRQACIAAARVLQEHEQAVYALEHDIELFGRDADARQRGLDDSLPQQERLLGLLAQIARHPPDRLAFGADRPLDQVRGELLAKSTILALQAQARALAGEISRIAELRQAIAAKQEEVPAAREALDHERQRVV